MLDSAPMLTSKRLVLRAHSTDDFADCLAMWSDPAVIEFIGGKASSAAEVWYRLLRYGGLWPMLGYGYWAITDRASGAFLGEAGLADFKREITPPLGDIPETGWAVCSAAQGQGIATEAMQMILNWSDQTLAAGSTCCLIDTSNIASVRVAEKLGYVADIVAEFANKNKVMIYRRQRCQT